MAIQCDVLVAGAGTAGTPAAVVAARAGLRTVVVERSQLPGGTAVNGMHRFICGLYANAPGSPRGLHENGIVQEILCALGNLSGVQAPVREGRVYVLPFSPAGLAATYVRLMEEQENLELHLQSTIRAVSRNGDRITAVTFESQGTLVAAEPAAVIDSTGDGVVLKLAEVPRMEPSPTECQLAGFTIRFAGLIGANDLLRVVVPYRLAEGVRRGALPAHCRFTTFMPETEPGEGTCKLGVPAFPTECRDERAHEDGTRLHRYLRSSVAAFRDSTIVAATPHVLDREGVRLLGQYVLTEDDVVTGRRFSDGVVRNAWPIEFWHPAAGPRYRYLPPGREYYEIPLRCCRSAVVRNLLCAGRCISATPKALASTRVIGACMALGEAAGIAAGAMAR